MEKARKAEAYNLFRKGVREYKTGQIGAALQSWQQALTIYREIGDRAEQRNVLPNLSNAYFLLGNSSKGREYQQQMCVINREIGDHLFYHTLPYYHVASSENYNKVGKLYQNIEDYERSLTIAQETGDRSLEVTFVTCLNNAYRSYYFNSLESYRQAAEYHELSLRGYKSRLENHIKTTQQIRYLSQEGYLSQEEAASFSSYKQADEETGNYSQEIVSLTNLVGIDYRSLRHYQEAIEYHQQALEIAQEIGDRSQEAASLSNLGIDYHFLGEYQEAIKHHRQALEIAQEIGDRLQEATSLGELGTAYFSLGQYQRAIEHHQLSLEIARKISDRSQEAAALSNLGITYRFLGQYQQAIRLIQQSLAIIREIGDGSQEAAALGNLGNVYFSLHQYKQALEYHEQSLAIAQEIDNCSQEAAALGNLGIAYYFLGEYQEAIKYYQRSLRMAQSMSDRSGEAIALNNLGLAFFQRGNLIEAERKVLASIQVLESLRVGLSDANKVSIFEAQVSPYFTLKQVLVAQKKFNEAVEIAERGRARAFVELLAKRLSANSDAIPDIDPPNVEKIQQIAFQQKATLIEYSVIRDEALYIWVIHPTAKVTFRQANLKSLDILLKNLVTDTRELIGVRDGSQPKQLAFLPGDLVKLNDDAPDWEPWKVVAIDAETSILSLTQSSFPEGLTIPRPLTDVVAKVETHHTNNPRLQQLYQLLIEPIADLLPTDPEAHVIFIPQKELFLVPFPALQDANGKYLIEKHTILTAPAIQVLDLTRKQQRTRQMLNGETGNSLVVGNPTMPKVSLVPGDTPQQLTPLPHAEKEAQEIARLLQTNAITGNKATKAAIVQQMPNARLIHLATHGLLDDQYGMGSAIALAPDPPSSPLNQGGQEGGNGLLTAEEILQLHLSAELVVLSACNTGMGRITGDGVIGLSRCLISAGVPSVIVSLWSVPDAPTADLMREFYQNFLHGSNKAAALRQAMLTTMQQHPNPRNWAAFTLIGEAD